MVQPSPRWTASDIKQYIELLQLVYHTFTGTDGSVIATYQESTTFLKRFSCTLKQLGAYTEHCSEDQTAKTIKIDVEAVEKLCKEFQSFLVPLESAYKKLHQDERSSVPLVSDIKKARANAYMSLSSLNEETKKLEEAVREHTKKISRYIEKTNQPSAKTSLTVAKIEVDTEILEAEAEYVRNRAQMTLDSISATFNKDEELNFGAKQEAEKHLTELETVTENVKRCRATIDKTHGDNGASLEDCGARLEEQKTQLEHLEDSLKDMYKHARRTKKQKQVFGWASSISSMASSIVSPITGRAPKLPKRGESPSPAASPPAREQLSAQEVGRKQSTSSSHASQS